MSVYEKFKQTNMMDDIQRLKDNPAEIGDMLRNSGRINDEQYNHIHT